MSETWLADQNKEKMRAGRSSRKNVLLWFSSQNTLQYVAVHYHENGAFKNNLRTMSAIGRTAFDI